MVACNATHTACRASDSCESRGRFDANVKRSVQEVLMGDACNMLIPERMTSWVLDQQGTYFQTMWSKGALLLTFLEKRTLVWTVW
jgi:hypothetical protein